MTYACLAQPLADDSGRALVSLREADMLDIGRWRNDQMDVLRQNKLLTDDGQRAYFRDVVLPTMQEARPKMILASYLLRGTCIGYGGLTNIDWEARRAELSFLVATARTRDVQAYRADFEAFLALVQELAFVRLGLMRLFTETYDIRPHHVAALEASGMRLEGRLRRHQFIAGAFVDTLFHGMLSEEYLE
jgi:RimJ/RimL family protein N-acetyltransferase